MQIVTQSSNSELLWNGRSMTEIFAEIDRPNHVVVSSGRNRWEGVIHQGKREGIWTLFESQGESSRKVLTILFQDDRVTNIDRIEPSSEHSHPVHEIFSFLPGHLRIRSAVEVILRTMRSDAEADDVLPALAAAGIHNPVERIQALQTALGISLRSAREWIDTNRFPLDWDRT
jgi:hypothetical protein